MPILTVLTTCVFYHKLYINMQYQIKIKSSRPIYDKSENKNEKPLYFNSSECFVGKFAFVVDLHSFCD